MARFLRLGDNWINLDHVQSVTIHRRMFGRGVRATVHIAGFFGGSISKDFDSYEDAEYALRELFEGDNAGS